MKRPEESLWDPIEGQCEMSDLFGDDANEKPPANEPEPPKKNRQENTRWV